MSRLLCKATLLTNNSPFRCWPVKMVRVQPKIYNVSPVVEYVLKVEGRRRRQHRFLSNIAGRGGSESITAPGYHYYLNGLNNYNNVNDTITFHRNNSTFNMFNHTGTGGNGNDDDNNGNNNDNRRKLSNSSESMQKITTSPVEKKKKLNDALFGCIERMQDEIPFGNILDAGTGLHSLRWIATLLDRKEKGVTSFTAITADHTMKRNAIDESQKLGIMSEDINHIIVGDWFDDDDNDNDYDAETSRSITRLLPHKEYDTIIADYLIGAIDGFSPYRQEEIIPMLSKLLKPGGNLYIIGLEPIPEKNDDDSSAEGGGDLICKVRRTRDACIQLAGQRCYREFPVRWIERQILNNNDDDLEIMKIETFPILYHYNTILRQINVGRRKLLFFPRTMKEGGDALANAMELVLNELDKEAKEITNINGPIKYGFDYVVWAQKKTENKIDEGERA